MIQILSWKRVEKRKRKKMQRNENVYFIIDFNFRACHMSYCMQKENERGAEGS